MTTLSSVCLTYKKVTWKALITLEIRPPPEILYEKTTCQFQIKFLLKIIYKWTKHYNYLQTYLLLLHTILQTSKLLKHISTVACPINLLGLYHLNFLLQNKCHYLLRQSNNAKLIKAWIKLKLFVEMILKVFHIEYILDKVTGTCFQFNV
jgi:hypothetical protein